MNTTEIEDILTRLPIHTGVFAADERPACKALPAAYVFNLDSSTSSGTHWVAVFLSRRGCAEYLDSFGRPPTKQLKDYLSKYVMVYNDKVIQDPFSTSCGAHCISFLFHRYYGIKLKDYVKRFSSSDLSKNDKMVEKFLLAV